jgi:hypothetical protein
MEEKQAQQWAFIFETFGKETLREMLFKAAVRKDEDGRVVIEFDGLQAMDVSDHYKEMENQLDR